LTTPTISGLTLIVICRWLRTTACIAFFTICTTSSRSPISATHLRSAFMTISATLSSIDAM